MRDLLINLLLAAALLLIVAAAFTVSVPLGLAAAAVAALAGALLLAWSDGE